MSEAFEPTEFKTPDHFRVDGRDFELFLKRRRGTYLYRSTDGTAYLRLGTAEQVNEELGFHLKALELGFPIAPILAEGREGTWDYWVEASLGNQHWGHKFAEDVEMQGCISDESFEKFAVIVDRFVQAQDKTREHRSFDWEALARAAHFDDVVVELPEYREQLERAWEKIKIQLTDVPVCLTHGDFNAHNVMENGVIDFGDHFEGPVGYDLVTAITTPYWFPKEPNKEPNYEYRRGYEFTAEQVDKYLESHDLARNFDENFLLRGFWWTACNHRAPKLQAWRYERLMVAVDCYLAGGSVRELWRSKLGE